MAPLTMREKIAGGLYGLLVGDALGCPVEGWERAKIVATWGELETMEESADERWRPRGLHSDDGQQAIALCDAILASPDDPVAHFARTLVALARVGPQGPGKLGLHRGTGKNFRATVRGLMRGQAPGSTALPSAGNGVAMMIAPAGWWHHDDDHALARMVGSIARVKTVDPRAVGAAGAIAYSVARTLRDPEVLPDPAGLVAFTRATEAKAALEHPDARRPHAFSLALEAMLAATTAPREQALTEIAARATATAEGPCDPANAYAPASVVTAIYLARCSGAFDEAVIAAVNLGGDADTVGAMVGAMAGVRFGLSAVPLEWLNALVARGAFDDRVEAMADRRSGSPSRSSLLELEQRWTPKPRA